MSLAKPLQNLIDALERLPGIGPKTAARLAFYLLHVPQHELETLAGAVLNLKSQTIECEVCHNIDVKSPCSICADQSRDHAVVCVVEDPLDVLAVEKSGRYRGVYHVLHGLVDPLNHVRPEDLRIGELLGRLGDLAVKEIILATNPSTEGETTAMYLKRNLKSQISNLNSPIKITRIARGLPVGADLEYADGATLRSALEGRREY